MSIREIKNSPVNSGAGMSIREAFDVVNANFNYLAVEAIPEQIADAVEGISASFTGGNIATDTRVLSNTVSTSSTTGALVVDGGAGISGDVNVGGTLTTNGVSVTTIISAAGASISGNISTANFTVSASTTVNSLTANTVSVSDFSTLNGVRNNGNLEIIGETTFRSNIFITGQAGINTSGRLRGNTIIATGSVDSTNTSSGALQVIGGAGIAGNIFVGGNLTVAGIASVGNTYVPSGSTADGIAGQMTWDENYFYVCVGTDQWIRFAKDTQAW
jgi:hypothetical protein